MNTGDKVNVCGANGIVCAALEGKARVQLVGATHGPTWMQDKWIKAGWLANEVD